MSKRLVITSNPNNLFVRHFVIVTQQRTQFERGREVVLKPDIRLQSLITPLNAISDIADAHGHGGKLTVFVRSVDSWNAVENRIIDKIYQLLDIRKDDRPGKLIITRV